MSLVNDLLDVSQLKAGKFKLNMLKFDLDKLLKDIIDIMAI
jgi:signal transduction histidine kinase